jgi:hypothetical protein
MRWWLLAALGVGDRLALGRSPWSVARSLALSLGAVLRLAARLPALMGALLALSRARGLLDGEPPAPAVPVVGIAEVVGRWPSWNGLARQLSRALFPMLHKPPRTPQQS